MVVEGWHQRQAGSYPKALIKVRIFSDGLQGVTEKFLVCIFCTRNVFHSLIE